MAKTIKVSDIKWAYNRKVKAKLLNDFMASLSLFIGEILRSDEIGLLVWRHQPVLMFCLCKVDFKTEKTYVEVIGFEDSGLENMMMELNLHNKFSGLMCSGFELFCYRPKPSKLYHPKLHPTYIRARERASRILNGIWSVAVAPDVESYISFAQVDEKTSINFFKETSKGNELRNDAITDFLVAVNNWIAEFYTDDIGSKQYKTTNRYPLAPKPLKGCLLHVLTSDDDDNLIFYKTEV